MNPKAIFASSIAACCMAVSVASAAVSVSPLFSSHTVLQRGKPCPVWGTAIAGRTITVSYNSQTKTATADAQGNWRLSLDSMTAKPSGSNMTIGEAGGNTLTITDVVVGDVWICSGQSNMAFGLGGCNRQVDIDNANYPGIRTLWVPLVTADNPQTSFTGSWTVCSPSTANGFSATAFYFARKIYTDQNAAIPIGLIASTVGGTRIDPWLVQEGCTDMPVLAPIFSQSVLPWGPFSLANGMIHPLAPYACKGAIWYQGENSETTVQSSDSYYLKLKALSQGWKRMTGSDDFAFYVVQIANWGTTPANATPVLSSGGWDADTRLQQANAMALPHAGMASAIDIGETADMHPKDKADLGDRLGLWALKNDYGRTTLETSGPILRDVTIAGNKAVCTFEHVGTGLMVGSKTPYVPTQEVVGGTLALFSIAGSNGTWYSATATIVGNTVELTSASVAAPNKVAYACWQNPLGANLYNKDGLPASPFYVDDITKKYTVTASAGANGSISPTGAVTYLKRKTVLYTITPNSGFFVQDVLVDGVSVGAVNYYTFDPLYANHTIAATFAATPTNYNITTSANTGGSFSPAGPVAVAAGGGVTLNVVPDPGYRLISMNLDGASIGRRNYLTFADVRAAHLATAFFAAIPTPGTGTGLRGEYFVGQNFEVFRSTRTDAAINFDWGTSAPIGTLPADGFSIRWQGQLEPQFTETYKFYLTHDDGVKLWVNNQLVINNWGGAATDDSGTIALTAGVKVPIKIEYCDALSNAYCKLDWSSPSIIRENVPQTQLYPATDAIYNLTTTAGTGGAITPNGTVLAYSGANRSFNIVPDTGYGITNVLVDGVSQGAITTYPFTNIIANHTLSATFATLPTYAVSGKVVAQGAGSAIAGATVGFYPSATATGSPSYTATTDASGNYTKSVPMGTWYAFASATNYFVSAAQAVTVGAGPVTGVNFALAAGTRNVPLTSDLLFSAVTDTLPASGTISSWSSYLPAGQTLAATNTPAVETIHAVKWARNLYADGDGFTVGSAYVAPIAVNGVSMVVAIKPARSSDSGNWRSIVDIFYDRLVLGINNNSGQVVVRLNGGIDTASAGTAIPDGQMTVLSLVVQPNGTYKVWANGTQIMSIATVSSMTSLVNGVAGSYANYITVGRNWPDGWSTYNGNIGDVFVYKVALTDAQRQQLEADVKSKFGMATGYTLTATAGAGGTVSPAGATAVAQGGSLTYAITPNTGYSISSVLVDGVSQGAISSYPFSNVIANHTIAATFAAIGNTAPTISTIPDQNISPNSSTAALPFTVGDAETPVANLTVTAVSSNTTLVPNASVALGGSGADRSATVTPAAGQTGTTTITLTVSDGTLTASSQFVLTVTAAPLVVAAWNSVGSHAGTPRAVPVPEATFIESRATGIRRLEIAFSKPIAVSGDPNTAVTVSGVNAAGSINLATLGITVGAAVSNSTLVLEFAAAGIACALPDAAKWRITLDPARITGTDGATLGASAQTARVLAGLIGDFDGNGRVSGIDLDKITNAGPFDPLVPASVRADIDGDGVVGPADLTAAWANRAKRVDQLSLP